MKKLSLLIASLLVLPLLVTGVVSAQNIDGALCAGSELKVPAQGETVNCDDATTAATSSVNNIIATTINIISLVVGVVAVIMLILGGLKYITSGGDSGNVTGAKNTILYAIIGLVVVALAQIIVQFVLNRATPVPDTSMLMEYTQTLYKV